MLASRKAERVGESTKATWAVVMEALEESIE
jgi:hypothetical protein